ncbi:MAG: SUMF1/EgtB/PvdO family nonheme iron enzyme [Lacibacter sp.]|jgi:gliding motility-associated lipoprotein GldJ
MKNLFRSRTTVILLMAAAFLASCKGKGLFKKKPEVSTNTGWTYNDPSGSGFRVAKEKEQAAGPGLVFVQGGTFTMGATEEDVMRDWNNIPRRVTVASFYMDETEVANVHYREYLFWLDRVFQDTAILNRALPDTLCWRSELAYNEPYVEYYFRHPSYNYYPVVGVSWKQAHDYCLWRTDRVNENILWQKGITNKKAELQKQMQGGGQDNFNTKAYLLGEYQATPGKGINNYKDPVTKQVPTSISFEEGIILPDYRLPTEAEWEYAAYGYVAQNPNPRRSEKRRGEELIANKQVYPWAQNVNGLRDAKNSTWQGQFLANFKRGAGDNMGVAGGLNDRSAIPGPIKAYYPNGFGLYNMAGNVSEWVADVYRPLTPTDGDDFNYFRGNEFKRIDLSTGKPERDSLGRIKYRAETEDEVKKRRNYQKGYVIDYLDGDSLSGVQYGYGITTLISDKSRVYKGGSWNDMAYWLSPGTRRFLEEDQSSSTIGFRCAMTRYGSQEGNGFKTGNWFQQRKQNSRKR